MNNTTSDHTALTDQPLAGTLVGENRDGWTDEIEQDFIDNAFNGRVGGQLLAETPRARIWEIRLPPGQRINVHRHVLDYFWTAIHAGSSRQRTSDGTTREVTYSAGETRYFHFGPGEYLLHDLENIGESELIFTTVEFLDSDNPPLELQ
jgi:beta-alanine degradation protein BauB